jgi:predicted RNA-binding Zn ribbon-like protein
MQTFNTIVPDIDTRRWCLNFVNTSEWRISPHPQEMLLSYADLVKWVEKEGVINEGKAQEFLQAATSQPVEADRALRRAIDLRENIYRIMVAVINQERPTEADLDGFNRTLAATTHGAGIVATTNGFAWKWIVNEEAFDSLMWPVALSAADLLVSEDRNRLGQCADDRGCGWIFLDSSKNHSRRWCDIRDCGNRAKQRRHYQKVRER